MFFYVILTTVCVLYYYFTRTLNYWQHKNVKGPKPIPLFGNFKDVALRRKAKFLHYNEIYKQYPEEKVVGVYQMTSPGLLIRDLDIVKQILIKDFELFPDRGTYFSKKGFGENMIHCDSYTWKNLRNKFTVLFTSTRNPVIQTKLRDEIDKVMDNCEGEITYEIIKEMKYLKMVFDETLRMHPTSHVITRNVKERVKLDGTDLTVDKGSTVIISPFSIQHDEKYYPEPEKFDPERFSPHNIRCDHPCAFLSFGAGRRGCLATQYARLQFSVGMTKLLYNFRVETTRNTCSNLTYDPHHMLIKPKPGVLLNFIPREK
ncbi:unnamed protein product [Arctia plantaginis]|uniref:unspecific monooxygenase n=1 Tax=Arctia plantaginis TaxID=874455 RepID=A0A8S1A269_ARCPL|nr:unnamed protein product [Arctia plantaginis]CAB3238479.1 unnamed protein product [Arctia plantaginis]